MFEARYQTFAELSEKEATPGRLAALRAELRRSGLDGFVVPNTDRHQNEYLPLSEARLAWLTGFTGSAGRAVVLQDHAVLFVDGRYALQAREQVDAALFEVQLVSELGPEEWIEAKLPAKTRLGYDPWLHSSTDAEKLRKACSAAGADLIPVDSNPLDAVWTDRPAPPRGAVSLHPIQFSGEQAAAKLERIRSEIEKLRADALVVSNTAAIAWAFNIRGADVAHTPVALAFAIVPKEGRPSLFIDDRKLSNAVRHELESLAEVQEVEVFADRLADLGRDKLKVRLDQSGAVEAIVTILREPGGKLVFGADPITQMKAVKNAVEISGMRAAQLRDGAAVAQFLAWFDREAPRGELTEIDCVKALESFRRESGVLKDISFPTIAGAGPNGAIVHYRVSERSDRRIRPGELFLIDSGGQYADGTTDITRTIAVGAPTAEMRDRFTRVLKGHIAIARARFPSGIAGGQLDGFARQYLWAAGLDYDHGTGHGVGSYLSVHEGPISIHKANLIPLKPGMILSNEPGYYKAGQFGIRIENLVLVTEAEEHAGADKPLLGFETLTLAPIDLRLVEPYLLSDDEAAWLDRYHARVRSELAPLVDQSTRTWLEQATVPVAR